VTLGRYMSLSASATGEKVNWINYKTKVKHIQFKLTVDDKEASLCIELSNPDLEKQKQLFNQFIADQSLLFGYTDENWQNHLYIPSPEDQLSPEGRIVSFLYQEKKGVNVYQKSDWPAIISFFKDLLIGLDKFWNEQGDVYSFINHQ